VPAAPKVLVIGLDPLKLDPAEWGVTAEHNAEVRARIAASEAALRDAGYTASMCLLAIDGDLGVELVPQLKAGAWDCVVIGGGIRKPEQLLHLFERVVNEVYRHAPQAAIAFNTRVDDVLETVQRSLSNT
jgi:hypothetical protein